MTSKGAQLQGAVGEPSTGQGTSTNSEMHASNDENPPSCDDIKSRPDKVAESAKAKGNTSLDALPVTSLTNAKLHSTELPTDQDATKGRTRIGTAHVAVTGVASEGTRSSKLNGEHASTEMAKLTDADAGKKWSGSRIPRPVSIAKRQSDDGKPPNIGIFAQDIARIAKQISDTIQTTTSRSKIPIPISVVRKGNTTTSESSSSDSETGTGKHQNVASSVSLSEKLTSRKDEKASPSKIPSSSSASSDTGRHMPKKGTSSTTKIGKRIPANHGNFTGAKSAMSPQIRNGLPQNGIAASSKTGKVDTARQTIKNISSPAAKSGKSMPSKMSKVAPVKNGKAEFVRDQSVSSSSSENTVLSIKTLKSPITKRGNSRPAKNKYMPSASSDLDYSSRQNPTFPQVECRNALPTRSRKVTEIKPRESRPMRIPSASSSSSENASRILMAITSSPSKSVKSKLPKRSSAPDSDTDCFACIKKSSTRTESKKLPPAKNARLRTNRAELFSVEEPRSRGKGISRPLKVPSTSSSSSENARRSPMKVTSPRGQSRRSRLPVHSSTSDSDSAHVKKTTQGTERTNLPGTKGLTGTKTTNGTGKHPVSKHEKSFSLRVPSASSSEYNTRIPLEITPPRGKEGKGGKYRPSSTRQPETDCFGCIKKTSSPTENRQMPASRYKTDNLGESADGTKIHRTSGRPCPSKPSSSSSENDCRVLMDSTSPTQSRKPRRFVSPDPGSGGSSYRDETPPHCECNNSPTEGGEKGRTTRNQMFSSEREKLQSREYEVSWPLKVPSASSSSSENASLILMQITTPTDKRGKGRNARYVSTPEPDVGCFDCMSEQSWQTAKERSAKRRRDRDERVSSENTGCFDCLCVKSPRNRPPQDNTVQVIQVKNRPYSSSSTSDTSSPFPENKKPLSPRSGHVSHASDILSSSAVRENDQLRRVERSLKQTFESHKQPTTSLSNSSICDTSEIPTSDPSEESVSGICEQKPSDAHNKPEAQTSQKRSPDRSEKQPLNTREISPADKIERSAPDRNVRPSSDNRENSPSEKDKKSPTDRNEKPASASTEQSSCRRQASLSSSSSDSAASRILMEITSPTRRYKKRHAANFSSAGFGKPNPRKGRSPSPDITNFIPDCMKSPTKEAEVSSEKDTASTSFREKVTHVDERPPQASRNTKLATASSTVAKLINMMSMESHSAVQPSTSQGQGQSTDIRGHTRDTSAQTDNSGHEDYSRMGAQTYSPASCDLYPRRSCLKITEPRGTDRAKINVDKGAQPSKNNAKEKGHLFMRPYALDRASLREKDEETKKTQPYHHGANQGGRGLDDVKKVSRSEAIADLTRFRGFPEAPAHFHQPVFAPVSREYRYTTTPQPDHFSPREIFCDDSTPDMRAVEWVARQCELNEARREARRHPVPTPRGRPPANHHRSIDTGNRVRENPIHPRPRTIARSFIRRWRRARAWLSRCCGTCEAD